VVSESEGNPRGIQSDPRIIQKPSIIICSLGRTGTKFFYTLFSKILPESSAFHEPDVFNFVQYRRNRERVREVRQQLKESGVSNLVIRKALGRWSLISISDARFCGRIDYSESLRRLVDQRKHFVHSQKGEIFVESNVGYYGLIDVLNQAFQSHRVVYLIRDGRSWVRSQLNWGEMYGKGGIRHLLAHNWPGAEDLKKDEYHFNWRAMSQFEKLCWAWLRLNQYALRTIQENPNAKLFYFEDIFESKNKGRNLAKIVKFATGVANNTDIDSVNLETWLERPIHQSRPKFPPWNDWTNEQKMKFWRICGEFMNRLGYA